MICLWKEDIVSLLYDFFLESKNIFLAVWFALRKKNVIVALQYVLNSTKFYFTSYFAVGIP